MELRRGVAYDAELLAEVRRRLGEGLVGAAARRAPDAVEGSVRRPIRRIDASPNDRLAR